MDKLPQVNLRTFVTSCTHERSLASRLMTYCVTLLRSNLKASASVRFVAELPHGGSVRKRPSPRTVLTAPSEPTVLM